MGVVPKCPAGADRWVREPKGNQPVRTLVRGEPIAATAGGRTSVRVAAQTQYNERQVVISGIQAWHVPRSRKRRVGELPSSAGSVQTG